jgi:hypothetical protein
MLSLDYIVRQSNEVGLDMLIQKQTELARAAVNAKRRAVTTTAKAAIMSRLKMKIKMANVPWILKR